MHSLTTAGKT